MKGQMAHTPFGDVLSELYVTHVTGILTVTQDKQTKAIFIEEGNPVFAISNRPEDQLGSLLVGEGRLTQEQLSQFGSGANAAQLAQEIAAKGLMTAQELSDAIQRLVTGIITSIFEWTSGEFSFEKKEKARLSPNLKLTAPAPQLILIGVRKSITDQDINRLLSNPNQIIQPSPNAFDLTAGALLDPMEGYV
ncbi:MAG: DUF4388 domain-containing protein, partial [Blastocatellia bacterium]|nr:DUF4388 domain-containing protein [Blastocatellia bacterium]